MPDATSAAMTQSLEQLCVEMNLLLETVSARKALRQGNEQLDRGKWSSLKRSGNQWVYLYYVAKEIIEYLWFVQL